MAEVLELEGYATEIAHTGRQALDACGRTALGAALVDINLPDISGDALINELRARQPEITCIIITGHASLESAVNAVNAPGVAGYELKPPDMDRVLALCREIFARQQAQAEARMFRDIIGNMQNGIHIYKMENRDGEDIFRFLMGNPASEQITGVPVADLIGKTMFENFPKLKETGLAAQYAALARGGHAVTPGELLYEDERIPRKWFFVKAFPLPDQCLGVMFEDITGRKVMELELKQRELELQILSHKTLSLQEKERARLARELHDELGQQLTALRWGLDRLENKVHEPAHKEQIHALTHALSAITRHLRGIVKGLRPPLLDDLPIDLALQSLVDEFRDMAAFDIRADFAGVAGLRIPEQSATVAYRILQESLTNALRHSHATAVRVSMTREQVGAVLRIQDDGRGFDPSSLRGASGGFGLAGMRERAALCGGAVSLQSRPGRGTTVSLHLPLSADPKG